VKARGVAGHGQVYAGKPVKNYGAFVRFCVKQAAEEAGWEVLTGPVALAVLVYRERPASKCPKRRPMRPDEVHCISDVGDRTNFVKLAEDSCKGILFKDDCQVVAGEPLKLYGTPERLEILVRAVTETPEELLRRVVEAFSSEPQPAQLAAVGKVQEL
jgi:Holliday junction resolvase RusA-like endonuclease